MAHERHPMHADSLTCCRGSARLQAPEELWQKQQPQKTRTTPGEQVACFPSTCSIISAHETAKSANQTTVAGATVHLS
jgi:hypothetical protein